MPWFEAGEVVKCWLGLFVFVLTKSVLKPTMRPREHTHVSLCTRESA